MRISSPCEGIQTMWQLSKRGGNLQSHEKYWNLENIIEIIRKQCPWFCLLSRQLYFTRDKFSVKIYIKFNLSKYNGKFWRPDRRRRKERALWWPSSARTSMEKGKLGANAMKPVAAHIPTPWLFEPAKRSHDRADYCLGHTSKIGCWTSEFRDMLTGRDGRGGGV